MIRWFVYDVLFAVVYLALLPKFLWRMKRRGGYADRFADRFGRYPDEVAAVLRDGTERVWIHAVSVGEVYVAGQMMRELRCQRPAIRFVLSTTSSTGWREAVRQVGPGDVTIYCPLDFRPCVRRALDVVRPKALILTESEIWPNLLRSCARRGVPLFLVNARVSDRSAPGYRRLRGWFGPVLRLFERIQAQSEMDKSRLVDAGADPAAIDVVGSVKFDVANRVPAKEAEIARYLAACGIGEDSVVLLGGSTWPGEDAVLVDLYKRLLPGHPALRLVLAPRHFEKADAVERTIREAGFACIRKSRTPEPTAPEGPAVVLADTTGELMGFYGRAQIVFVGKSLCEHGAQNMIEPCLCGAATLVGPHTENFRPVMADLLAADAIVQVSDAEALAREIDRLAGDPAVRAALGGRAVRAVERRRGVVARCAADILVRLPGAR